MRELAHSSCVVACCDGRRYIDDDGNVIKMPGAQYEDNGVAKQY